MTIKRRTFLGLTAVTGVTLPFAKLFATAKQTNLVKDSRGLLDLAPGYKYTVLQSVGEKMSDGFLVPGKPDGMGCFKGKDGNLILMRNHELTDADWSLAAYPKDKVPAETFDKTIPGGVSRIVLDPKSLKVISSNLSLTGTLRNCGGGITQWGWLSCEEHIQSGHGYVFACDPERTVLAPGIPLKKMGRFIHEGAVVDPATNNIYMTEDREDGCLYRFIPKSADNIQDGRLQALKIDAKGVRDTFQIDKAVYKTSWVDVPDPDSYLDDLRKNSAKAGAAKFLRGEGIWEFGGNIFFAATSGGSGKQGQIFKFSPKSNELQLIAEATNPETLKYPDNVTVRNDGTIFIAEDGGDRNFIRELTPDGKLSTLAANVKSSGEFAGVCFSPDQKYLFVNMYEEGLTLAIYKA